MLNVSVDARFNESKHQMTVVEGTVGVALPNLLGTNFGLMFKDTVAEFTQLSLKSRYYDVVDWARDANLLDAIAAGTYDAFSHVLISMTLDGAVTVQGVTAFAWWAAAPTNSVSIAIPVAAGWAADGSTVYLTNVSKRVFERCREDILVFL